MAEFGAGSIFDVAFDSLPVALFVSNRFATATDRQQSFEHRHAFAQQSCIACQNGGNDRERDEHYAAVSGVEQCYS